MTPVKTCIRTEYLDNIRRTRIRYGEQTLSSRGITFEDILDVFKYHIDDYKYLLLTSSSVHGLANISSDIDVICIAGTSDNVPKMATQCFRGDVHYEIISFSVDEINHALEQLHNLASKTSLASIMKGLANWRKLTGISKKYTERLINGVDITLQMPFIDSMGSLSVLWKCRSYDLFRKCIILLMLSERAGEKNGRIGYAFNSLLYLMDMVMSHNGNVFSNKKWYLCRYKKFVKDKYYDKSCEPLISSIDKLYGEITGDLKRDDCVIGQQFLDLYKKAKDMLGIAHNEDLIIANNESYGQHRFLEESTLYYDKAMASVLCLDKTEGMSITGLDDLLRLDPESARAILCRIRAGIMDITLAE